MQGDCTGQEQEEIVFELRKKLSTINLKANDGEDPYGLHQNTQTDSKNQMRSDRISEKDSCTNTAPIDEDKVISSYPPISLSAQNLKTKESAQEPWPQDVKLYQPYEVEQILLPDNANCLAVQAFLKMCDLPYSVELRDNAEAMSPSGKVPFIKAGAFVIAELESIVQFANNKGITLTDKLDAEEKADMRAYMSLVHNVLENAELYICWCDDETYNEVTKVRYGSVYPWPLNIFQTRSKRNAVIRKLKALGWYQKSMDEVFKEVENCCQALTDRLERRDYFFECGCELDCLVYGHIQAIMSSPHSKNSKRLLDIITCCDNLMAHYGRIRRTVFKSKQVSFAQRVQCQRYIVYRDRGQYQQPNAMRSLAMSYPFR